MPATRLSVPRLFSLILSVSCGVTFAADWPTYRGDAQRSGYTAESLPAGLALRWTYQPRHAPQPAWSGRDTRMPFDRAYQPVIVDGMVFFGSSADCKVYALDAATGEERWSFFTDGPIRFAPAVWQDRLFVVSDDGFLYCLATADGTLLWKRRGGPTESWLLGNDRMISRWPARGGPAIVGDVVYWAAGIWPSEGIYLYATDAKTGKTLWCNDSSGGMYMPQPHGGANAKSGVSVQGYLVASGDKLIVPTGRAVPAAFSRSDGGFSYFHLQAYGHAGGAEITAIGGQHLNGGHVFDTATGKLAARLGTSPSAMAVTPTTLVYAPGHEIHVLDRANLWTQQETVDAKGKKTTKTVLSEPLARLKNAIAPATSLIVAGDTVAVGGKGRLAVHSLRTKTALLDTEPVGEVLGLAAAGGRLFVSTDKGAIYCFDAAGAASPSAVLPTTTEAAADADATSAVDEILEKTGVTEGYCLDLGCGDGSLTHELARRTELQIIAVDPDPASVASARKRFAAQGLYGTRVTVLHSDLAKTSLPNHFANLVVSGRSLSEGISAVSQDEVMRVLRPFGGIACLGEPGQMKRAWRGPLRDAGTWTHQYADPANTNCSTDTAVRGPLGALWFNDLNFPMPSRHGRGPAPLFYDGLLYVEGIDGLRCVDAYNGRSLWEYPLPGILKVYDGEHLMGVSGTGSNFCVGEQGLYVRYGEKCLRVDRKSGKLLGEFATPLGSDGKPGTWGMVLLSGDTLIGSRANTEHLVTYRYRQGDMSTQWTESDLLFAMDATTGDVRWQYAPKHSLRHNALAVGGGRVYLIDRPLVEPDRRRDAPPKDYEQPSGKLLALDLVTGKPVWTNDENIYGTVLALSEEHQTLVMCYQNWRFKLLSEVGGRMAAFDTTSGKRRWDIETGDVTRPILRGKTLYMQPNSYDLLTGAKGDYSFSRSYGCGIPAGSTYLTVFRSGTFGYLDFLHPHGTENYGGIRPGCWINAIPAGGLVLMPDATDRCRCSYLIKASIALQPWGLRAPAISPKGGSSREAVQATLTSDSTEAVIRYTLDGSSPTAQSPRYTRPLRVTKTATLKARAFAEGMPPSPIGEASFTIDPSLIPLDGPAWQVYDTPGGGPPQSKWQVTDGVLTELSNHYLGDAANVDPLTERPGTLYMYKPGTRFRNGELHLEMSSADNDGIGVAFRLTSPHQHYLLAWDAQRKFRLLAGKKGKAYRVLALNDKGYTPNRWYKLRLILDGDAITVHVDGEKDLEIRDATLPSGTFAFYSWGSTGTKFRSVRWVPKR